MSDSVQPHRRQPTRLHHPWDSPGKNTGVGCHFLLQCMKVKSESEVGQSCLTLSDPMDCSLPGSSVHGILQARVLEWGASAFSTVCVQFYIKENGNIYKIKKTKSITHPISTRINSWLVLFSSVYPTLSQTASPPATNTHTLSLSYSFLLPG